MVLTFWIPFETSHFNLLLQVTQRLNSRAFSSIRAARSLFNALINMLIFQLFSTFSRSSCNLTINIFLLIMASWRRQNVEVFKLIFNVKIGTCKLVLRVRLCYVIIFIIVKIIIIVYLGWLLWLDVWKSRLYCMQLWYGRLSEQFLFFNWAMLLPPKVFGGQVWCDW